MIICKKCHKAVKSETATEFCKCCYPEPATKESGQYKEMADYNRQRQPPTEDFINNTKDNYDGTI